MLPFGGMGDSSVCKRVGRRDTARPLLFKSPKSAQKLPLAIPRSKPYLDNANNSTPFLHF